ncbi:MAG: MarR family transcriptional regulator [Gemmatimonadetes bacterium]|nr:MarR family transcriptional regulator [Gemmatimonadota bacterium]
MAESTLLVDARALADALSELIRVVQFRDRDRACCYDISVSQCYALKGVVDAGALTINDLAAHLYLDKSTASRVANALVDKALLVRQADEADGRVVRLTATAAGTAVCTRIESDLAGEYAELLGDFEPEVRAAITRVVTRLGRSFAARVDASGGSCCVVG